MFIDCQGVRWNYSFWPKTRDDSCENYYTSVHVSTTWCYCWMWTCIQWLTHNLEPMKVPGLACQSWASKVYILSSDPYKGQYSKFLARVASYEHNYSWQHRIVVDNIAVSLKWEYLKLLISTMSHPAFTWLRTFWSPFLTFSVRYGQRIRCLFPRWG